MAVTVRIPVEDIATVMLTYTSIKLYSSTSPTGTFSLVTTITLAAATTLYSYSDSAGDANTVYQIEYYNATGPVTSSRSATFYASGTTLLRLRLEAARDAGAAFESTCSAVGTTTTLIDSNLQDMGIDTAFLEGAYIYRPNAATATDKVRRVKKDGYTVATFSLGVDRAWAIAPASGEVYHIFNFFPPIDRPGAAYSWDRAVREGLGLVWFVDQVNLGAGDGANPRVSLATWPEINTRTIRRVFFRKTDATTGVITDVDMGKMGRYWQIVENAGVNTLETSSPARTDQVIIVEAVRRDYALYLDTDVTLAPFKAATRAIMFAAYRTLNYLQPGKYAGEFALAASNWQLEREIIGPDDMVIGV